MSTIKNDKHHHETTRKTATNADARGKRQPARAPRHHARLTLGADPEPLTPDEQLTATEALVRVTPRALGLSPGEVILPYRLVPAIAVRNVRIAKATLARFRDRIPHVLPTVDVARIDGIEDTALALTAAAADADKVSSDGAIVRQLQLARVYRSRLLLALRALVAAGLVPMKTYADIAAGTGPRDTAQDCIDLPVAFRKHASAIHGKHPVTDADLDATAAVGTWLLQNLGTRGARALKPVTNDVVDLRNRVATLLVRDYEQLSIVGHVFLGDGYVDEVPPLRSRLLGRRPAAEPTPAPAPAPAPAPPAPALPSAS